MLEQTSGIRTTIEGITADFESAFASGDMGKVAEFYAEDGMLLPAGVDFIKGRQAIKAYWQYGIEMGIKRVKIDILEIDQHQDIAIEMSKYTLGDANGQVLDHGKGIVIWKNVDGNWQLHRDIWTSSLEAQ